MSADIRERTSHFAVMYDRKGNIYEPVVGPKLRVLLVVVFVLFALLGANSAYLASLKIIDWARDGEYRNWFYLYMFPAHLALGLVLIPAFLLFVGLHLR